MADYGAKVALPGFSITSTTPTEYAFNSSYGTVKIFASGSGNLTVNASSSNSVEINHGLPFVPLVMYWCQLSPSSGKWFFGGAKYASGDADAGDVYVETAIFGSDLTFTYVDETKFRLELVNQGGSNRTVTYKYLFFGDTAQA